MTQVACVPENLDDWPGLDPFWFTPHGGRTNAFVNYETRLWHEGANGALVWRSHPASHGVTLELLAWRHLNYQDRCRLMRGVDLYTALRPRGGRTREDPAKVCEEFRSALPDAICRARDALDFDGEPRHRNLRQHELAAARGMHEDTLRDRMKACDMEWRNVRRRRCVRTVRI